MKAVSRTAEVIREHVELIQLYEGSHKAVLCTDWCLHQEKEQRNEKSKNGPKKRGRKEFNPKEVKNAIKV